MSAFSQMFQARVKHFLDPMQLRAPQVAEIVEAFVHRRKAPVEGLFQCSKPLIDRYKPLVNADEALVNSTEFGSALPPILFWHELLRQRIDRIRALGLVGRDGGFLL